MFFNASQILGFGQVMPQFTLPKLDRIWVWYGGWSLQNLRDYSVSERKGLILPQSYKYACCTEVLPIGFYALRLPVTNSSRKVYKHQSALLADNEIAAHPVIIYTAEICSVLESKKSLLGNTIIRTGIKRRAGFHIGVERCNSHLKIVRVEDSQVSKKIAMASQYCIVS
jgi:hypothetical protein